MEDEKAVNELKKQLEATNSEMIKLRTRYESELGTLTENVDFMKEQLMAQHDMLKNAINHVVKLESEVGEILKKVKKGDFNSIH